MNTTSRYLSANLQKRLTAFSLLAMASHFAACSTEETPPGGDAGYFAAPGVDGMVARTADSAAVVGVDGAVTGAFGGSDGGLAVGDGAVPAVSTVDTPYCKAKVVLDKYCIACHSNPVAAGAPMSLVTYADTQATGKVTTGKKVYELIGARMHDAVKPMPAQGKVAAADLAAIDQWITAGAPAGSDPTCGGVTAPAPGEFVWPAECTPQNRYKILAHAAGGPAAPYVVKPNVEEHPKIAIDAPWGDKEVQALAFKPISDNRKVLHHWIVYQNTGGKAFVTGWAPGAEVAAPLPADVGMFLPSGAGSLLLDMHYNNLGGTASEPDQSGVEICAVPKAQFRKNTATVTMSLTTSGTLFVLAPANTVKHEETKTCTVTATQPVHMLTASPHAHTLAVGMRFTVTKKNGTSITLHEGPFAFEEQQSYGLAPEVVLETGDKVTTTCIFTNPTSRNVTFGESTSNEMCFNFAVYYPMGAFSCR